MFEQDTGIPKHFSLFPQADRATHWAGHIVQSGLQRYEGTFVSYLTRMVVQSEGDPPRSQTIAIPVLTVPLEFTDPPVVGSGGVEEWTFRANAAGTTALTLAYRQPWATDEPPAEQKTFAIVAR